MKAAGFEMADLPADTAMPHSAMARAGYADGLNLSQQRIDWRRET